MHLPSVYPLVALVWSVAAVWPNPETVAACKELESSVAVAYTGSKDFTTEMDNYWSAACKDTPPACIVFPLSAKDVSAAVQILQKYPGAKFTVKSGGHSPNVGHSSIPDGVLIALGKMKGATFDQTNGVAKVRPGGHWEDVIAALEPYGIAVVGGRLSIVGVAGLITGGGLSFLSAQHGLAGDTVLEFETVFPNGTIANINGQNHPDLFRAMKGSSNQFGIHTQFIMKAIPMGKVWGGIRMYSEGQQDKILKAFHDFTENPVDPKAAVIVTIEKVAAVKVIIIFNFYHGEKPPKGAFKQFEDIKPLLDQTKTRSYLDLLKTNAQGGNISKSQRTSFRSMTLPNVPGDSGTFQKEAIKTWEEAHSKLRASSNSGGIVASIALQSFPSLIGQQSEKAGGNAMGLRASDGGRFIVELTFLYAFKSDDDKVATAGKMIESGLASKLQGVLAKGGSATSSSAGKLETYMPFFINDAAGDQNVMQSYSEYNKFKALQQQVDSNGFLQKRIGGWKY